MRRQCKLRCVLFNRQRGRWAKLTRARENTTFLGATRAHRLIQIIAPDHRGRRPNRWPGIQHHRVTIIVSKSQENYLGETRERKKWVAVLLTFICPGLGLMYVGQMLHGLLINLLFLLSLELFIIWWSLAKFFPLLPFLVFMAGWLGFSSLIALENIRRVEAKKDYVLKAYNHWTLYLVVYLLSFILPISLSVAYLSNNFWRIDSVQSAAMFPGLQPGDVVLSDINELQIRPPERGELVAARPPGAGEVDFLRVVATNGDLVRMEGDTLYVNDDPITQSPLTDEAADGSGFDDSSELLAMIEYNQGSRYVISVSPRVFSNISLPPTELEPDRYFMLTDNRSQVPLGLGEDGLAEGTSESGAQKSSRQATAEKIRDSRHFGTISGQDIKAKPRYIFWSTSPDGRIRWDRIGLKTQ